MDVLRPMSSIAGITAIGAMDRSARRIGTGHSQRRYRPITDSSGGRSQNAVTSSSSPVIS